MAGCLALAYVFRAPLCLAYADLWIVNQPAVKADAIFVLGGGLQYRPFVAADFYHAGLAPQILISHAKPSPTDELGLTTQEKDLMRKVLLAKHVPQNAIQEIGSNVTSTVEETLALRDWALRHKARRVLIPTDIAHSRRARFIFERSLRGTDVEVIVTGIEPREYQRTNWWQKEEGIIAFQNELIKYALYLWRY
ncbi:MAG: YdcF family protein [Verrucomicrobiae bacterium]|nr:YdcF family protein [Verrucomicrobiae bacterium]